MRVLVMVSADTKKGSRDFLLYAPSESKLHMDRQRNGDKNTSCKKMDPLKSKRQKRRFQGLE